MGDILAQSVMALLQK